MAIDLQHLAGLRGRIEWHDSIGSTNDRAAELARSPETARHGFVVGADEQTAGRGRKGARWLTGTGQGLAFSLIVRPRWPQAKWGWLSVAAGLAVSRTLEGRELCPRIKWPNDVLLEERKVCGVLIEAAGDWAVIGIGINVNEGQFADGLRAISLRQVTGTQVSREELMVDVWASLLEVLEWRPPEVAEEAWERLAWRDRDIETTDGARGRIRGFGENGELTVETKDRLIVVSGADGVRLTLERP